MPPGMFRLLRDPYWHVRNLYLVIVRKVIQQTYDADNVCINVGGGLHVRKGWKVLDYSSGAYPYSGHGLDFNVNLQTVDRKTNPLPIKSGSVRCLLSSHCLEHVTIDRVQECFYEFHRILTTNGVFRLVVPDVDLAFMAWEKKDAAFFGLSGVSRGALDLAMLKYFSNSASKNYHRETVAGDLARLGRDDFLQKYETRKISPDHDFSQHVTWFNWTRIKNLACSAGFADNNVSRSAFGQSEFPMLRDDMDNRNVPLSIFVEMVK